MFMNRDLFLYILKIWEYPKIVLFEKDINLRMSVYWENLHFSQIFGVSRT